MDSRNSRRWNRKRRRDQNMQSWSHDETMPSTSTAAASNAPSSEENAIPGFYFDPERRRYFRILPEHLAAGNPGYVTSQSIKQRDRETQRQALLEKSSPTMDNASEPKKATSGSVSSMITKHQLGLIGPDRFRRTLAETRVRFGDKKAINVLKPFEFLIQDAEYGRYELLNASTDGTTIFGWGTHREFAKCLFLMDVKAGSEDTINISCLDQHIRGMPLGMGTSVRDACVFNGENQEQCLFGATASVGIHSTSVAAVMSRDPENDRTFLLDEAIWSVAGWRDCISVGVDGHILLNTDRRKAFSTNNKTPLVQRFSKDGNQLFVGLRASPMKSYDLRTLRPVYALDQRNVSSLHVMDQDDNYIVAGDYFGQVKLWDLRMRKAVREFKGQVNSHTKLPLVVNEEDSLIIAGGEDGTTRCWSLQTGELLREIASPYPVEKIPDVPAVCYSNQWGGRSGNAAIVLGVRDELHFHKI